MRTILHLLLFCSVLLIISSPANSQQYKILYKMSDSALGIHPTGYLLANNSYLYGTCRNDGPKGGGVLFRINDDGTNYKIIHAFDKIGGYWPNGALIMLDSVIFGMTNFCSESDSGVIYRVNSDGSDFKEIHTFKGYASDGAWPLGGLLFFNGYLYGMTQKGGIESEGTIFKIKPDGNDFSIMHSFRWSDIVVVPHGNLITDGKMLYGLAQHGVFRINFDSTGFEIIKYFDYNGKDGYMPFGGLLLIDTVLYGTTYTSTMNHSGTVFRINKDGSGYKTLHEFDYYPAPYGRTPSDYLATYKNKLYGGTSGGGHYKKGTIFSMNTDGSDLRREYSFKDGYGLTGGLILHKGKFFGVNQWAGKKNYGQIFTFNEFSILDSCNINSFDISDFSNFDKINYNGKAELENKEIKVCPNISNERGSVFYNEPIPVLTDFTTEFSFKFTNGFNSFDDGSPAGADGIAFILQGVSKYELGTAGGGIGYSGIDNSIAIEFDAYNNTIDCNETNGSHLSVFSNGKNANSSNHKSEGLLAYTTSIPLLKSDSTIYYSRIEYNLENLKLAIWIDTTIKYQNNPIIIDSLDLPKLLNLIDGKKAFIGFSSSTGTSTQNTYLLSWSYCYDEYLSEITDIQPNVISTNEILISPNPASDYIEISLSPAGGGRGWKVEIFNVLGDCLETSPQTTLLNEMGIKIDISNLAPGVYFIKIGYKYVKFVKI